MIFYTDGVLPRDRGYRRQQCRYSSTLSDRSWKKSWAVLGSLGAVLWGFLEGLAVSIGVSAKWTLVLKVRCFASPRVCLALHHARGFRRLW